MGRRAPVPVPPGSKYCFQCLTVKPVEDFYVLASGGQGRAAECKVCFNIRMASHRAEHRASNAAYARAYRAARPNLWRERRARNPEKWLDDAIAGNQRAKARKKNAPGDGVSRSQWVAILNEYGHRCAYCARQVKLTMDHVVPLSKGGAHDPINVVPACRECNSGKWDRNILQWLAARVAA